MGFDSAYAAVVAEVLRRGRDEAVSIMNIIDCISEGWKEVRACTVVANAKHPMRLSNDRVCDEDA